MVAYNKQTGITWPRYIKESLYLILYKIFDIAYKVPYPIRFDERKNIIQIILIHHHVTFTRGFVSDILRSIIQKNLTSYIIKYILASIGL